MRNPKNYYLYEEHFIKGRHYRILQNRQGDLFRVRCKGRAGKVLCYWLTGTFDDPGGARLEILKHLRDGISGIFRREKA